MARITKTKFISDIELQVNQGAVSSSSELERSQIAFWITNVLNGAVARECDNYIRKGEQVPPIYIARETCQMVEIEDVECTNDDRQRMGFVLDGSVLDTDDDNGILQVLTPNEEDEDIEIYKASLQTLPMFKAMRYSKPSADVLLWSRQGSNIFVDGLNENDVEFNLITVFFLEYQDVMNMADDDEIVVTDKTLGFVMSTVVNLAKNQLYGGQADQTNDGVDPKQPAYHQQISRQQAEQE